MYVCVYRRAIIYIYISARDFNLIDFSKPSKWCMNVRLDSMFRFFNKKGGCVGRPFQMSRTRSEELQILPNMWIFSHFLVNCSTLSNGRIIKPAQGSHTHIVGHTVWEVQIQWSAVLGPRLFHLLSLANADQWASQAGSKAAWWNATIQSSWLHGSAQMSHKTSHQYPPSCCLELTFSSRDTPIKRAYCMIALAIHSSPLPSRRRGWEREEHHCNHWTRAQALVSMLTEA